MLRSERDKLPADKKNFVLTQFPRFLGLLEEELRNATSPVWDPMFKLCDLSTPSIGGSCSAHDRPLPSPITLIHSPTPSDYSPLHSPNKPTCSPRFHCAPATPSGSASPVGSDRQCSGLFGHNGGGGKRRISERLKRSSTAFCNLAGDSDWVLEEGITTKRSRLGASSNLHNTSALSTSFISAPSLCNLTADESFNSAHVGGQGGGYWSEVEGDISEEELRDVLKELEAREEATSQLDSPTSLVRKFPLPIPYRCSVLFLYLLSTHEAQLSSDKV